MTKQFFDAPLGAFKQHFKLAKLSVSRSNNFLARTQRVCAKQHFKNKTFSFIFKQFFKVNS
uniref:Uncharacterized protein n=1 Tax=viral metagenome TaxID=1070528 RepID=A0A6C0B7F3_9ZZZZ